MMSRLILIAAISAGMLACGETDSSTPETTAPTGGKGDQSNNSEWSFSDALKACEDAKNATLEDPEVFANHDIQQAVGDFTDCLKEANTEMIPVIESNLAELGDDHDYAVSASFRAFAEARAEACVTIIPAYEMGQGSIGTLLMVDCVADGEFLLSRLIASFVDAQGAMDPSYEMNIEDLREGNDECFDVYDSDMDSAQSQAEMNEALHYLAQCAREYTTDRRTDLGIGLLNHNQVETYDEAGLRVSVMFNNLKSSAESACHAIANASAERGGTLADLHHGECLAISALSTLNLLKTSETAN